MRKLLLSLAILGVTAHAGLVAIADVIKNANGTNYTGIIYVTLSNPGSSPGGSITMARLRLVVIAGVVSCNLEANDAITPPGTSYNAKYEPRSGPGWTESWLVPTSVSPLTVAQIRINSIPTATLTVQPSQITQAGATTGQALAWNGSSWAPISLATAYMGSALIDVVAVPDGACVLDSTAVTVTGAALGGKPTLGSSFQPPEGVHLFAKVTGPNSMKIEVCNLSGANFNPSSATYYFGVTP